MELKKQLELQYDLLGHKEDEWTEFRILRGKDIIRVEFVLGKWDFIIHSERLIKEYSQDSIFIGLNPRKVKSKGIIDNIKSVNVIMIDLDPIRPVGQGSTEEQHGEAIRLGKEIVAAIPNSVLVDSGSGAHAYIPIVPVAVSDSKALTQELSHFHSGLIKKYEKPGIKIDHTFDLPRVTRLWGSFNPKSKRVVTPLIDENTTQFTRSNIEFSQQPRDIGFSTTAGKAEVTSYKGDTYEVRFDRLVKVHPSLGSIISNEAKFDSTSERTFAFVASLVKAHFQPEEIQALAVKYVPRENKTTEQFRTDVERIIDKISNNGIGSLSFVQTGKRYYSGLSTRTTGITSGIEKLDQLLAGFQKGKMYVNAARTNEGKTSLSCQLSYNFCRQGKTVVYFPTELGYEPLFDKLVAGHTNINLRKFQSGSFSDEEKERIGRAREELSKLSFVVHENFALTTDDIEKVVREVSPDVIVVDFIQAMKYERGGEPGEIARNVRTIKELTDQYGLVTILDSQFSRAAIGTEVSLAHLKGSGAIEEFADVVMALSTLSKNEYPRPVDLHILKSRYSEIGKIRLDFYSSTGRFEEHKGE